MFSFFRASNLLGVVLEDFLGDSDLVTAVFTLDKEIPELLNILPESFSAGLESVSPVFVMEIEVFTGAGALDTATDVEIERVEFFNLFSLDKEVFEGVGVSSEGSTEDLVLVGVLPILMLELASSLEGSSPDPEEADGVDLRPVFALLVLVLGVF